jgi:RNA polymerase sigma-70 factor (sigma-E family)
VKNLEVVAEPLESVTPDSFVEFYRDSYARMVRLAYLLTGSVETAQDLVQDAFVRTHRRWDRVESPSAYVQRAVVNACISDRRRGHRERKALGTIRLDEAYSLGADELFDALGSLPARQRAAVVLRFYEDQNEAAIAATLGCRPGTVGSLIHRGLEGLKKELT